MDLDRLVATHRPRWDRLRELTRKSRLSGEEADEFVELYGEAATDLSTIRSAAPDPALVADLSALVARARGARHLLIDGLEARGARVDEVELYEAVPEPVAPADRAAALAADYVTFTASSTVRSFVGLLDADERARLAAGPRVVSIGPITSATAREEGLTVHAEATEHTIPGLVAALREDAAT